MITNAKVLKSMLETLIQKYIKGVMHHWDLFQEAKIDRVGHAKTNVIYHINKIKEKNYMITLIDAEKSIWQNSVPMGVHEEKKKKKTLRSLRIGGNVFKLIKDIREKPIANIVL